MLENNKYKISVITAVYNAESCIQNLIESLRAQKDKDFEWVVVDGASTDRTLEILKSITYLNIKIISEPDFGIYDALNKGIKACSGEYYLVAGADDIFYENAIQDYKVGLETYIDMLTANVVMDGAIIKPRGYPWIYGQSAFISNHALGVIIRKSLHMKYGYYSNKFPIAADQLFIQKCALQGSKVEHINTIVGIFNMSGVSGQDRVGALTEFFRIQLLLGRNKWIQYILYVLKLIKRLKG